MPATAFVDRLNDQIANEFGAHQQYVAIAVHYDAETLPRLAAFFYAQALEERNHAMMMVQYLMDAGVEPVIPGVEAPRTSFADMVEPVEAALEQERRVSDQIEALAKVAREDVEDRALTRERGVVVRGKAVPQERRAHLLVVLERDRGAGAGLGEDLVEQVEAVAPHVELEQAAIALQPGPGDDTAVVLPDPDRPLVLPPFVLAEPPRDVADVPLRPHAELAPLLEGELVHRCDDLGRESHV